MKEIRFVAPSAAAASEWHNKPLDETGRIMCEIKRCKVGSPLRGIVLSDTLLGRYTHFVGGRGQPHVEEHCEGCLKGIAMRWHSWLIAKELKSSLMFIMELTAITSNVLYRFEKEMGGLRGYTITQTRVGDRENGRINVTHTGVRIPSSELPECPDLRAIMCKVWEAKHWMSNDPDQVAKADYDDILPTPGADDQATKLAALRDQLGKGLRRA